MFKHIRENLSRRALRWILTKRELPCDTNIQTIHDGPKTVTVDSGPMLLGLLPAISLHIAVEHLTAKRWSSGVPNPWPGYMRTYWEGTARILGKEFPVRVEYRVRGGQHTVCLPPWY